jgi:hypothetical protein
MSSLSLALKHSRRGFAAAAGSEKIVMIGS